MLALTHLALDGQPTPSQLRRALGCSPGGITAVVRPLERDGHITRHANPSDGRSRLVRPAPAVARAAAGGFAPLVAATVELIAKRSESERRIIEGSLSSSSRSPKSTRSGCARPSIGAPSAPPPYGHSPDQRSRTPFGASEHRTSVSHAACDATAPDPPSRHPGPPGKQSASARTADSA
jgi:DNA-binding MarR family transcriptional regulator